MLTHLAVFPPSNFLSPVVMFCIVSYMSAHVFTLYDLSEIKFCVVFGYLFKMLLG